MTQCRETSASVRHLRAQTPPEQLVRIYRLAAGTFWDLPHGRLELQGSVPGSVWFTIRGRPGDMPALLGRSFWQCACHWYYCFAENWQANEISCCSHIWIVVYTRRGWEEEEIKACFPQIYIFFLLWKASQGTWKRQVCWRQRNWKQLFEATGGRTF